jgi:hypothetical protein
MQSQFRELVVEYLRVAHNIIELMISCGIPRPTSHQEWLDGNVNQMGEFGDGTPYFRHGIGIAVRLPIGVFDFDFGPSGEIDIFDRFMFTNSVLPWASRYGYESEAEIFADFDSAVEDGDFIHLEYNRYRLASLSF